MPKYYSTQAYQIAQGANFLNVPINQVFDCPEWAIDTVEALANTDAWTEGTPLPAVVAVDFQRKVAPSALAL